MPTSKPTVAYSFQGSKVWVNTEHRHVRGSPLSLTAKALGAEDGKQLTFLHSFFSSFFVKTVWTHQILVNIDP